MLSFESVPVPTIFKRDPHTFAVLPAFEDGCDWVKNENNILLAMKIDGIPCKIEYSVETQKKLLYRRMGESWFVVDMDKPHNTDKYVLEAYNNSQAAQPLPAGIYVAYGPQINGNPQHASEHLMIRTAPIDAAIMVGWGAVGIKRGAEVNVHEFYRDVRKELEESTIEGFVFIMEHPHLVPTKMGKITRKDFGFKWPVEDKGFITPSMLKEATEFDPFLMNDVKMLGPAS